MTSLFSKLSIISRISLGFIVISCFLILISAISLTGNYRTAESFKHYALVNQKAADMLIIDNKVTDLQRIVQEYINTGYETIAEKSQFRLEELRTSLDYISPSLSGDLVSEDYLKRMHTHLKNYSQTFTFAVEEIRNRKQFLSNVQQSFTKVTEARDVPADVKNVVFKMNNNLYAYINDPDILLITASLEMLEEKVNIAPPLFKEKLLAYKKDYIDVVQSTRGYLFLIAVVMAGEAQEFKHVSTMLKDLIWKQKEPINTHFANVIEQTYTVIVASSTILLALTLLLSYSISHSISRPLNQITRTFKSLANNQHIENIPGINLQDEIGSMSRAAETFRLNNEKTRMLVKELAAERTKLKSTNKELEQFARITSHDLQEPLRTISSFTELFDKQYQHILDDKGKKYLAFINEASRRMHSLIHGILEYSRIGKVLDTDAINLNLVVEDVLKELTAAIADKAARIDVGELPEAHGNQIEYRSLFMNLISNSLKFVKHDCRPHIEIGCMKENSTNIYFVKDNGIGIEASHKDKVFMIFQRIQNRKDYPGNGIGLAYCKKIVESHNGRIWLESKQGKGCTFFFTIGV